MKFKVDTIKNFEREARRLKKNFPSLKGEISELIDNLESDPYIGNPLGKGFYKIRVAIKSKGKGKRGGGRVITFIKVVAETVYLVSIYDKSEKADISNEELNELFGVIED